MNVEMKFENGRIITGNLRSCRILLDEIIEKEKQKKEKVVKDQEIHKRLQTLINFFTWTIIDKSQRIPVRSPTAPFLYKVELKGGFPLNIVLTTKERLHLFGATFKDLIGVDWENWVNSRCTIPKAYVKRVWYPPLTTEFSLMLEMIVQEPGEQLEAMLKQKHGR